MQSQKPSNIRVMRIIARMNIGGPAVQISGLMRGLDDSQFTQKLYTGFCSPGEADYLETVATDIKATRIAGFGRRINLSSDLQSLISLVKEIRLFKPHIIHTHTAKAGVLGRIASLISMHPSIRIHTYHGHLLNGYYGWFKTFLVIQLEKLLAIKTNQLLAVGERVRDDLLNCKIGTQVKFQIMPPGLVLGKIEDKQSARDSLGILGDGLQCAFIGRITQIKRPDRFLDVVEEIKKSGVPLQFLVAGSGDLLDYCENRINKNSLPVKMLGWQTNIEKVLGATDIVILTSDNEGMPLSLIQAGMAGIPIVATNVGSVSEIVLDTKTGLLTTKSTLDIVNALELLCQSSDMRKIMGAAAKDFTVSRFGVERLISDHERLYQTLIKPSSRPKF